MNPKTTALLLIEYQNDFVSEGGALHGAVKGVMASTGMLANSAETADRARTLGAAIMFAPITFAKGYREISATPYGILKGVVDGQAFQAGSWGAEIVDALPRQPEDIIIEGKRGLDVFASTNLDFILRSKGIETLAVAGFLTNCCVESTVRTGYERGYKVIALTDCTATVGEEEQRFTVEKNLPMFSRTLDHRAFLNELRAG
jgi:ureidoacrylate peracid hydrolase